MREINERFVASHRRKRPHLHAPLDASTERMLKTVHAAELTAHRDRGIADSAHAGRTRDLGRQHTEDRQRDTERAADEARSASVRIERATTALRDAQGTTAGTLGHATWESASWREPALGTPPATVRLGRISSIASHRVGTSLPYAVPLIDHGHVVLEGSATQLDAMAELVQGILLRLFAGLPPGALRMRAFDQIRLGASVAPLAPLTEHNDELTGGNPRTTRAQLIELLDEISTEIAAVQQNYLQGRFATLAEYNAKAAALPEPYRVLVVHGFPHGFDRAAASQLRRIAESGPSAGVIVVATIDADATPERDVEQSVLRPNATWLALDAAGFLTDRDRAIGVDPDGPPPVELLHTWMESVGRRSVEEATAVVELDAVTADGDAFWGSGSATGLEAPIGLSGRTPVRMALGRDCFHGLISGQIGQGKSNLLHTTIASLATRYSPAELELQLVDMKRVEFSEYGDPEAPLPHASVVASEADREFAAKVVARLSATMDARYDQFAAASCSTIDEYREARPAEEIPRIVLMLDEFQVLLGEQDTLAASAGQHLSSLARLGRGAGIHLLLCTQTLTGLRAGTASSAALNQVLSQTQLRLALRCGVEDSRSVLHEKNIEASQLKRRGEAIFNAGNGLLEHNRRFQVAHAPRAGRTTVRERCHALAPDRHPFSFRGGDWADLRENRALAEATAVSGGRRKLWLGAPVDVAPALSVNLERRPLSHLAILGEGDLPARGMLQAAVLGLCAQHAPGTFDVHLADFDSEHADLYARALRGTVEEEGGTFVDHDELGFADYLEALHAQVSEPRPRDAPIDRHTYVVAAKFDLALLLASDARTWAPKLETILKNGPMHGVHALWWWTSPTAAADLLNLRNRTLFSAHAVLHVQNPMDLQSRFGINVQAPARLRGWCVDQTVPGPPERFVPYGPLPKLRAALTPERDG